MRLLITIQIVFLFFTTTSAWGQIDCAAYPGYLRYLCEDASYRPGGQRAATLPPIKVREGENRAYLALIQEGEKLRIRGGDSEEQLRDADDMSAPTIIDFGQSHGFLAFLLLGFEDASNALTPAARAALRAYFKSLKDRAGDFEAIEVIGHTDFRPTNGNDYDALNGEGDYCLVYPGSSVDGGNVARTTNECIGLLRLKAVKEVFNEVYPTGVRWEERYSPDPFLDSVNADTAGDVYAELGLQPVARRVKDRLPRYIAGDAASILAARDAAYGVAGGLSAADLRMLGYFRSIVIIPRVVDHSAAGGAPVR